jgi:hypothetical protein
MNISENEATSMSKKPVMRAIRLEEALLDLMEAERTLALVETSDSFQAFTDKQKRGYRQALGELRDLIHDLTNDTSQELAA